MTNTNTSSGFLVTAGYTYAVFIDETQEGDEYGSNGGEFAGASLETEDTNTEYVVQSLPYVTVAATQAQAACAASVSATKEEATRAYLVNLCEAKAWNVIDPDALTSVIIDIGTFAPEKGIYMVTFSSAEDPAKTATTIVVVEDTSSTGAGGTAGNGAPDNTASNSDNSSSSAALGNSGNGSSTNSSGDTAQELIISSELAPAFQIVSTDTVAVQLQLDELDVAAVKTGQQATVELTALEGQEFAGVVSSVTSSSGSYYAEITLTKSEGMYVGFSATATIIKEQVTDVVTIPLAAVNQQGADLFVYTTATEDGELGGRIVIETGLSDEDTVEVISGIAVGTTVYYQQQIATGSASNGSNTNNGFGGMGGEMPNFGGGQFSAPDGSAGARPSFNQ
jgi:hypothetical protein